MSENNHNPTDAQPTGDVYEMMDNLESAVDKLEIEGLTPERQTLVIDSEGMEV